MSGLRIYFEDCEKRSCSNPVIKSIKITEKDSKMGEVSFSDSPVQVVKNLIKAGEGFVRMNIACTKKNLKDGLERLKTGVRLWEDSH